MVVFSGPRIIARSVIGFCIISVFSLVIAVIVSSEWGSFSVSVIFGIVLVIS